MSKIRTLTTTFAISFVASMIMPDSWLEKGHVGEVPLAFIMLTLVCCLLYIELFGNPNVLSLGLLGGVGALFFMAGWGYLRGNIDSYSLKFFAADVFCLGAFLAGLALGRNRNQREQAHIVICIAWLATIGIIVEYAALFLGVIQANLDLPSGRQVTLSIFNAGGVLLILLPWASVASRQHCRRGGLNVFAFVATLAAMTMLSGTRSALLVLLLAIPLCGVLNPKWLNRRLFVIVIGSFALVTLFLASGLFETVLFERLATSGIEDESRSTEVSMLLDQISNDLVLGQGMGSRFVSDVVIDGDPLASAPHVGILTFLMKGGVLAFVAYAIAPALFALTVLFSSKRTSMQRGAAASMLTFLTLACMSGGWSPLYLLAYGLAISGMTGGLRPPSQVFAANCPPPAPVPALASKWLAIRPDECALTFHRPPAAASDTL